MGFTDVFAGLRQNQRVNVRIIIEEKEDVLKIRNGAFLESSGGRMAYVIDDDIAERRDIVVGARSIAEVEIISGLREGEQIIISSLDRFNGADRLLIKN
jgi:HlyD family secretion protein